MLETVLIYSLIYAAITFGNMKVIDTLERIYWWVKDHRRNKLWAQKQLEDALFNVGTDATVNQVAEKVVI